MFIKRKKYKSTVKHLIFPFATHKYTKTADTKYRQTFIHVQYDIVHEILIRIASMVSVGLDEPANTRNLTRAFVSRIYKVY